MSPSTSTAPATASSSRAHGATIPPPAARPFSSGRTDASPASWFASTSSRTRSAGSTRRRLTCAGVPSRPRSSDAGDGPAEDDAGATVTSLGGADYEGDTDRGTWWFGGSQRRDRAGSAAGRRRNRRSVTSICDGFPQVPHDRWVVGSEPYVSLH